MLTILPDLKVRQRDAVVHIPSCKNALVAYCKLHSLLHGVCLLEAPTDALAYGWAKLSAL